MKSYIRYILLFSAIFIASCGLFGGSDDDPVEFAVELDREVLVENASITITANNPTSNNINLLISRTGDPHLERMVDGDWVRLEEAPPSFGISTHTLEPGQQRIREVSYTYIDRLSENPAGEYRVYYNYYLGNQEEATQTQYSETFTVE